MMRIVLLAALLSFASLAEAQDYSADAFATCAACHLPDGAGVPGAFPRIRDRAARIAALDGGREYLVTVVTYGLMGAIEVDGNAFYGIMAGNIGMSNEELAAALNYVVFELNDNDASDIEPFTASEVEAVKAATTLKSPAGGGELRVDMVAKHGDEWP
jgi:mono/diheme cytochrome c family protein